MTPAQYCEARTRGAGSSFFYAFLFLPEEQRRAMMALYAFCREVDDIADEVSDADVAMRKLGFWEEEIERAFRGAPSHPVGRELNWARSRFALNEELFREILDGMRMDVARQPIQRRADLSLYCYRVAGVVGLLTIDIFGHRSRQAARFATTLGEALQYTNILRDLAEDAARGRIYLPREDRLRHGVADEDFMQGSMTPGMRALLGEYVERTGQLYDEALDALPAEDRASLRPSLVMGAIYHAHYRRIRQHPESLFTDPPTLAPLTKIWIAWRMWRREKRAFRQGQPPSFEV